MPTETFAELKRRLVELQREAEALRTKEVKSVIAKIKIAIEAYGLTAEDLGLGVKPTLSRADSKANAPTYADGGGRTWTGHGRRPKWVINALAAGKTLEELRALVS